jgi:hypothetical protein
MDWIVSTATRNQVMKEHDSLVAHTDEKKKKGKNSPPLQVPDLHLQALKEGKSQRKCLLFSLTDASQEDNGCHTGH